MPNDAEPCRSPSTAACRLLFPFFAATRALIGLWGPHRGPVSTRRVSGRQKCLKGAKPADIRSKIASRFRTTVNLKSAKALGLELSPALLAAADEVIE
jgi:putative tryptophan/tyrosine transport system substrate-binding protein